MQRFPDWEIRLGEYIAKARGIEWGDFGCGYFVAGAIEAMTGENPLDIEFDDETSLKDALAASGDKTLYIYLSRKFGRHIPPAQAQRGDIVQLRREAVPTMGVMLSRNKVVFLAQQGLAAISVLECERAWRIARG